MWQRQRLAHPTEWGPVHNRPRVLIEHHDGAITSAVSNLLVDAGFDVSSCSGPEGRQQCSLVHDESCAGVDEADVIVFGLELSDEDDRAVLESLKARRKGIPIVVEATGRRADLYQDELENCIVIPRPMNRASLLDAIERALSSDNDSL